MVGQIPENFLGIDILIVVDAGSEEYDQHKILKDMGIELLIFDHHKFSEYPENAILVSSAKFYENPALSGAGVTWKVCAYIDNILGEEYSEDLLDLCASGIIGDICVVDETSYENRYLCYRGFNSLKHLAIKEIVGAYEYNSTAVSYSICPLINASQRTSQNELAVKLFLSDDIDEVRYLINALKRIKEEQDESVKLMMQDLEFQIRSSNWEESKVVFGFVEAGNHSGLLAGKIADKYSRPCIILHDSPDSDKYKGSMRSVGVKKFRDIINTTKLGYAMGHDGASGVVVSKSNYKKFVETLNKSLESYKFTITQEADIIIKPDDLSIRLIEKICSINKISGNGFPPIKIVLENVMPINSILLQGKHSKFTDGIVDYINWNSTETHSKLSPEEGCTVICDILGVPQVNVFRGRKSSQVIISDIKIRQELDFLRDLG